MVSSTTTSNERCFWIKGGPRGTRSGFTVLPDGSGGRVTITVLPKPWSSQAAATREYAHRPGTTTHIVMHETELAALRTAASSVGALALGLTDIAADQADLLDLGAPPKGLVPATAISGDPFGDLVDLVLLADRGKVSNAPLTFEGAYAPSLLRLLTHERLLQAVETLILRARPRYAERTEILRIPRGRLAEGSLLFSLATGTPRLESTFDELSTDTPLLQVVASALRIVASERIPPKIAALRPRLQIRAVQLLRYLSGVTLLERERAALMGEKLWLSPLDRMWKPAIDAALPVLRGQAVVPSSDAETSEAFQVSVSTEKFWEQCLELTLESAFGTIAVGRDARPGEGVDVPAPWAPPITVQGTVSKLETEGFPDFMFQTSRHVVVADAKYKLAGSKAPSSQDGYQLFAYSHLATLGGQTSHLALILYPTQTSIGPRQQELERLRDRDYPLWLVRLPFPTRADIHTQANWSKFIAQLTRTVRGFSAEWTARHDAGLQRNAVDVSYADASDDSQDVPATGLKVEVALEAHDHRSAALPAGQGNRLVDATTDELRPSTGA